MGSSAGNDAHNVGKLRLDAVTVGSRDSVHLAEGAPSWDHSLSEKHRARGDRADQGLGLTCQVLSNMYAEMRGRHGFGLRTPSNLLLVTLVDA